MGELAEFFRNKYFVKDTSFTDVAVGKVSVRNTIDKLCTERLSDFGQELIFEVLDDDLPYAVMVINEEPLCSKYIITQIDKSLFSAQLREIDF